MRLILLGLTAFSSSLLWANQCSWELLKAGEVTTRLAALTTKPRAYAKFLNDAGTVEVRHLTRAIAPPPKPGTVAGFQIFPAGEYLFTVTARKGGKMAYFVIQTEGTVPHISPVDPGKTKVNGSIRETDETGDDTLSELLPSEQSALLGFLLAQWGTPVALTAAKEQESANASVKIGARPLFLNALAAVYANGTVKKLKDLAVAKPGVAETANLPESVASILTGTKFSFNHTTRSLSPVTEPVDATVEGFQVFGAGSHRLEFTDSKGLIKKFYVITEGNPLSHLAEVDPGVTQVNGSIFLVDNSSENPASAKFTQALLGKLLSAIIETWGKPSDYRRVDRSQEAGIDVAARKEFVNALAAIYANGNVERLNAIVNP